MIDTSGAAHLPHGSERCDVYHRTVGRCQLVAPHSDLHALSTDGAYLTWLGVDVSTWHKVDAPAWLFRLPWAGAHGPGAVPVDPREGTRR